MLSGSHQKICFPKAIQNEEMGNIGRMTRKPGIKNFWNNKKANNVIQL